MKATARTPSHRSVLLPLAIAGFGAVLIGCAAAKPKPAPEDSALPQVDMLSLKENADEALKLSQDNRLDLQSLTARVKEIESQLETLSEQFSALPLQKIGAHDQSLDSLQIRVAALEARLSKVSGSRKIPATFSTASMPVDEAVTPSSPAQTAGTLPEPRKEKPRKGVSAAEASLYQKAFNLFYARNYTGAIPMFQELRDKYPQGNYADHAVYWIGECQFALGNYAKAIASFRAVFTYKETEKADDAQLKLGYCYLRLGDRKSAAEEFRKVVSLYPNSEYLERAKSELAKLEPTSP